MTAGSSKSGFTSQKFIALSIDRPTEVDGLPVVHVNMAPLSGRKMLLMGRLKHIIDMEGLDIPVLESRG